MGFLERATWEGKGLWNMHRMCSLQQPRGKARIYAGCRGVKRARFIPTVTQFAQAAVLPLVCPGDPQLGFFCGDIAAISKATYQCLSGAALRLYTHQRWLVPGSQHRSGHRASPRIRRPFMRQNKAQDS